MLSKMSTMTIEYDIHTISIQIPYMIMMLICLAGSVATSFLPETLGAKLPETLEASHQNISSFPPIFPPICFL